MKDEATSLLETLLNEATASLSLTTGSALVDAHLTAIAQQAESAKGVLAVLVSLLAYKVLHPEQDIRCHQSALPGGFSGRTFDTACVTPFLKKHAFPSMSSSGWLTRSLEQPHPYTLDYPGKIQHVKEEFLQTLDHVQCHDMSATQCLRFLLGCLLKQREQRTVTLASPHHIPIAQIINYLEQHFNTPCVGSARLPVIAIYSAYECMMKEVGRYAGKTLLPLESHTSADARSGRAGDIDVSNEAGTLFEAVEVKHKISITPSLVQTAYDKFKGQPIERYYLLTTYQQNPSNLEAVENEIGRIARQHGCQVIVNGVYSTLKYYLRLLKEPDAFVACYIRNLAMDAAIKYEHKEAWNTIVGGGV